jgi:hypothetical protein
MGELPKTFNNNERAREPDLNDGAVNQKRAAENAGIPASSELRS